MKNHCAIIVVKKCKDCNTLKTDFFKSKKTEIYIVHV